MIIGQLTALAFDVSVEQITLHGIQTDEQGEPHDVQTPALVIYDRDVTSEARFWSLAVPLMADAQVNVAKGLYDAMDADTKAEFKRQITGGIIIPGVRS